MNNGKKLEIFDYINEDNKTFDYFYPNPELAQEYCRKIYTTILGKRFSLSSIDDNYDTVINRFALVDIKFLEHPLIIQNIISYVKDHEIITVIFNVHHQNINLAIHYKQSIVKQGIAVDICCHQEKYYWKNTLSKSGFVTNFINVIKFFFVGLFQVLLLLLNKLSPFKYHIKDNTIIWHGFANNREKVDYKLLNKFQEQGFNVLYPNPYIKQLDYSWNKSIYFLSAYSANPYTFLKLVINLLFFKRKFNQLNDRFKPIIDNIPTRWNSNALFKVKLYLVLNHLSGSFIRNVSRIENQHKIINVFRGGAAAGLVYSGVFKERYQNKNIYNYLVTHGTEFNVIDHFSYFYLDYNVLPSIPITNNWNFQLENRYTNIKQYNKCTYVAGGRIDYELLALEVNKHNKAANGNTRYIGIVLTYLTVNYQSKFIKEVIQSFSNKFKEEDIIFLIKPRPNVKFIYDSELYGENLSIHNGDIFSFLNKVDLVVGTVSIYGVLTMVVTDAIYCNIPAIYYLSNNKFNASNLGYSYHISMDDYTFSSIEQLNKFISSASSLNECFENIMEANKKTSEYLQFNTSPSSFLIESFNRL